MKNNPRTKGAVTEHTAGIRPEPRDLGPARTRGRAVIAGRPPHQASPADVERAKRELPGDMEMDRQEAALDALPEGKRWDPVPGSAGHQAPESPSDGEDDEGRSEVEQLVDEGAIEAARDSQLQAAKDSVDRTKPENLPHHQ